MERILAGSEVIQDGDIWRNFNGINQGKITNTKWLGRTVKELVYDHPGSVIRIEPDPFDELLEKLEQIRKELWQTD